MRKHWLREAARGEQCYLRLFDDDGNRICNGDSSTVVLCHLRIGGVGGTGQKPHDLVALPACHSCHDVLDKRTRRDVSELDRDTLRGLCQWLQKVGVMYE